MKNQKKKNWWWSKKQHNNMNHAMFRCVVCVYMMKVKQNWNCTVFWHQFLWLWWNFFSFLSLLFQKIWKISDEHLFFVHIEGQQKKVSQSFFFFEFDSFLSCFLFTFTAMWSVMKIFFSLFLFIHTHTHWQMSGSCYRVIFFRATHIRKQGRCTREFARVLFIKYYHHH